MNARGSLSIDAPLQEPGAPRPADAGRALVADTLHLLLRADPAQTDAVAQRVLQRLAAAVGAGRCALFLAEGRDWSLAAHVASADSAAAPLYLAPDALEALGEDPGPLRRDQPLLVSDTGAMAQTPFCARLIAEGVQALAAVPLMHDGGALAGLISLERFETPGAFGDDALWAARMLGDGLVAVMARRRRDLARETALARQTDEVERLRGTLAALPELMVEVDGDGRCVDFHAADPDPRSPPRLSAIGRTLEETLPADLARLQRAVMEEARRVGSARVPRYSLPHKGEAHWYDTTIVHLGTIEGQERFVFRVRDVSTEQARAAENAMLVEVTRNMTNLAVVLDSELRVVWINPAVEQRTGYTLAEVRGRPVSDFADSSSDPEALARLGAALLACKPCREEFLKHDRNGTPYWVDVSVQPMTDAAGNPQGFMLIENDITALKQHEAELERLAQEAARAHDRLHAAIESLQDGFAYFDSDDRLVLCNERYRQMLPHAAAMMVPGVPFEAITRHAVLHGDYAGTEGNEEAWIAQRLEDHRSASGGSELRLADGRWLRVFEQQTPEGGRVGLRVDITALKQAEARLNDIIVSARVGTWTHDAIAGTTEINEQWWRMLGYDRDLPGFLTRELWCSLVHPDDSVAMTDMLRGVRAGALDTVELELRLQHRNGHSVRVLTRGRVSQRDASGEVQRISGVGLDVTERRQAEERLRAILESSSVGTWQLDCQSGTVIIDEPYAAMLGYRLEDLLPWTRERFDSMVHPEDLPRLYSRVSGLYGSERSDRGQEFRMRHQDGRWIWVLSFTSVQRWAAPGVPAEESGIHIDVTERKQHEAALAEAKQALEEALAAHRISEQRYTDIAAASHEFFWEIAPGRLITHITAGFERSTGIPAAAVLGRTLDDLGVVQGRGPGSGDWQAIAQHLVSREPVHNFLFSVQPTRRRPPIWLRISGAPFYAANGEFAGYRGVGSNVSALIAATERAEAASQAKSRFLANMSHELRTPLTGVLGMAELLGETRVTPRQREMIDTIRDSGEGLLAILNDILDLAKVEAGKMAIEREPFALVDVLSRIRALFEPRAAAAGLEMEFTISGGPAQIRLGDANRIVQVLMNLVGNAVKFTHQGRVSVTAGPSHDDPDLLRLEVADTGIGMNAEQQAKVFEEFEQAETSTARRFGGTGLGLSITRRLAALMGGTIKLDSVPDQGTRVTLHLPAPLAPATTTGTTTTGTTTTGPADPASDPASDPAGAPQRITGLPPAPPPPDGTRSLAGLRLLVADDNLTNRRILDTMLRALGTQVTLAEDGQSACDQFTPGAFDAVLLDISMPGLDGLGALAAIRAAETRAGIGPVPALAVTANAMQHQIEEYRAAGFSGHVAKPFRKETLARALSHIVASPDCETAPQD